MLKLPKHKIACVPLFDADRIGHIWIPDSAKERCDQGLVKYIGDECELGLHVGDHILFSGYVGTMLEIEGEGKLIIMHEDFITAVIKEDSWLVPGLYFKSDDGSYFEANYEIAMLMCGKAYDSTRLDVHTPIPTKEEAGGH